MLKSLLDSFYKPLYEKFDFRSYPYAQLIDTNVVELSNDDT